MVPWLIACPPMLYGAHVITLLVCAHGAQWGKRRKGGGDLTNLFKACVKRAENLGQSEVTRLFARRSAATAGY